MSTITRERSKLSVKTQTLAAAAAIVGAVALPQILHMIGAASGLGTALGETFLPMHLPVILAGLLAGPFAGAAAGLLSPLASFAMTGMPTSAMLPFMIIELFVYGLLAGLLKSKKMPNVLKVLAVQIGGRAVRAGAILLSVYVLGNSAVNPAIILTSIKVGIFGLLLQLVLIPLIVYRSENAKGNE